MIGTRRALKIFVLTTIFCGILFRIFTLAAVDLCFDEAREFWRAKGIDTYDMNLIDRPLESTLVLNSIQNAEPPLMCILLHFWSRLNNSVPWLRFLSCIFGIGTLFLTYFILRTLGFNDIWSLGITSLCSWSYPWVYYSKVLKGYSLVIFASALTLYLFLKYLKKKKVNYIWYVLLGLSVSFGCFCRYEFWILLPFFISALACFLALDHGITFMRKTASFLIFLSPIILTCGYIYIAQLTHLWYWQEGVGKSMVYLPLLSKDLNLGLLEFTKALYAIITGTFTWMFFSIPAYSDSLVSKSFSILSLLLLISCVYNLFYSVRSRNLTAAFTFSICIYSIFITVILSILGIYPIAPDRYSLFLSPFLIISFFLSFKLLFGRFISFGFVINKRYIRLIPVFVFMLFLAGSIYNNFFVLKAEGNEDMLGVINKISLAKDPSARWFISFGAIPAFKYHYFYSNVPFLNQVDKQNIYLAHDTWNKPGGFINEVEGFLDHKNEYFGSNVHRYFIFSFNYENEYEQLKDYFSKSSLYITKEQLRSGDTLAFVLN